MKPYDTVVKDGKMLFVINEGSFTGVKYFYKSLSLEGDLKYKIVENKNLVNDENKFLFENTIRHIIKDKLSKI